MQSVDLNHDKLFKPELHCLHRVGAVHIWFVPEGWTSSECALVSCSSMSSISTDVLSIGCVLIINLLVISVRTGKQSTVNPETTQVTSNLQIMIVIVDCQLTVSRNISVVSITVDLHIVRINSLNCLLIIFFNSSRIIISMFFFLVLLSTTTTRL